MRLFLALLLPSLFAAAATRPPGAAAEKAYFYIHTVTDMDKSIAFYRDVVGLKPKRVLSSFPTDRRTKSVEINRQANTPDAFFRPMYFELPGNDYGFELLEFTGIERTAIKPRLEDPGATFLILQVRNINSMLAKVKASGATVVSASTAKIRSVWVRDLDGFYLLLEQPAHIPAKAPKGEIAGAAVGATVADAARTVRFYQDMFGFAPGKQVTKQALADLTAIDTVKIPNSTFELQLWEFKGSDRKGIHPKMQDPGAPQFSLQFPEPAPARTFLQAEGVEFLSPGVVYDPNGILVLVRGETPNH